MSTNATTHSPPASGSCSGSSSPSPRSHTTTPLSLDLSDLPPLDMPSPPSNTLLITNLLDPETFHPAHLTTIRQEINSYAPIHSFAPLKFFRRLVVSFYTTEAAIAIRSALDGQPILGHACRIYFGEPTPISPRDQHLEPPHSQKLFFISPPPSPPHGWEMRNEGPPNKEVHADDLASALAKLHAKNNMQDNGPTPRNSDGDKAYLEGMNMGRGRSGSTTVVYHPSDHGDSPALPAVMVEDLTGGLEEVEVSPLEGKSIGAVRTERPPVDAMDES